MSKFVPSEYIDFRKPFLQTLFDIRDRGALADSQHDVHGIVRPETEIPDGVAIGSEQKRNAKERAITLDLPLDAGAVTIDLNFCWQCRDGNQVPIAHVVKNRVRGYLSGQLGHIGNRETLPYIGVRPDEGNDLLFSLGSAIDRKGHANAVRLHYSGNASRHLSHPAFQSRSKLEGLYSPRCDPDIGVAGIDQPGRGPQEANQETALKHHQKHGKRHTQHGHGEARAIVNDVLPG